MERQPALNRTADPQRPKRLEAQLSDRLRDYATVGMALFWQRMLIYSAGIAIGAYYIDTRLALIALALFSISEAFDLLTFRKILHTKTFDPRTRSRARMQVLIGGALNSGTICIIVLWISAIEGPGIHYMAFFILFAASLFAAMNSHQLISLLKIKMVFYGTTFLFIPAWDIVHTGAALSSPAWMHLFTNVFFLYFMIECARIFMHLYQRQLEQIETLRQEHEKVETAYRKKSEFLSTMSHELRTPMTSINGAVILARSGKLGELPPRVNSTLAIAEVNCRRLSMLINDVLDLQKIESGKMKLEIEPLELGEFLNAAIEMNSPYGAEFKVDFHTELPSNQVFVQADRHRLNQVMANLLSNAAKFSHAGDTVTIRLEADERTARILVIDTGIGLSEADRDTVFDQFSQVDASDKRQVGGSGLGMAISEQILAAHGATIDYRKNPGPGTTFTVEMKRSKAPQNDQDSDNTAALATGGMNGVSGAAASSTSLPNLADAA